MKGTVKRFNAEKGFGFITGEDEKDYFFHYSSIEMEGYKTVAINAAVEFEAEEGPKGLRAKTVKIVGQ